MMQRSEDRKESLRSRKNERGVALLIVLLVIALLIALVFEFAYATRISVNSAVNYRDSQRAYFLARAGIKAFEKAGDLLRGIIDEGKWGQVPIISKEGTIVMARWEDERGKLNINMIAEPAGQSAQWVKNLFSSRGISTEVVDRIEEHAKELKREGKQFTLISELRALMSDEDYRKICFQPDRPGCAFLTVDSDSKININTASEDVLRAVLINDPSVVTSILSMREDKQIQPADAGLNTSNMGPDLGKLQGDSTFFKVYSYATVGDYEKKVEAVISGGKVTYWRAL